jgi:acyl dehydratase
MFQPAREKLSSSPGAPFVLRIMRAGLDGGNMAKLELASLRDLKHRIGEEVVVSDWLELTQERIDQFAAASGDHQWIHVDVERARRESPFGAPIAHGFLTLSLLSKLLGDSVHFRNAKMGVNYGCNRVRFTAPVPVGSRIRARFAVKALEEFEGGAQVTWNATMEREGSDRPCLVAEWLTRRYD